MCVCVLKEERVEMIREEGGVIKINRPHSRICTPEGFRGGIGFSF